MKATFALLLLLCAGLAIWGAGERSRGSDLEASLRSANYTRDTIRARNAEREVRYMASNDSLKNALQKLRMINIRQPVVVRADTVLMPVETYVMITDTILPRCEQCAARLDSLVAQNESERRAALHVESLMRREIQGLRRQKFMDRVGVFVGYGAVKVGPDIKAGWQVGVGIRAFP